MCPKIKVPSMKGTLAGDLSFCQVLTDTDFYKVLISFSASTSTVPINKLLLIGAVISPLLEFL
jgi:hypothetical protein